MPLFGTAAGPAHRKFRLEYRQRLSDHYMSSKDGAQGLTKAHREGIVYPILWSALLTLLVAGPWLLPGYIFGTDWPGPRQFSFPTELTSSAPLQIALGAGSRVLSGELMGKLLVFGLLFVAAFAAFHSVPTTGFVPRAAASTVYAVNPFVYGRLHYGEFFLLGAYAVLPVAVLWIRRLLLKPGLTAAALTAVAIAVIGMFSPHVFLIVVLLGSALFVTHLALYKHRHNDLRLAGWLAFAAIASLVMSSYWVVPLLSGSGHEGGVISSTGAAELTAYAAVPDKSLGLVPNLLGLYGFWAENTGRFLSMKAFVPFWPAVLIALLLVCAAGAIAAFWQRTSGLAPWVAGLLLAGAVGFVLEIGVSNPLTSGIVTWLDAHIAIYRGMRDAGKWGALLALVYSQLSGLGAAAILIWVQKGVRSPARAEWAGGVAAAMLLALPLYYGNGLLFGAHGEIKPSTYPAGWYAADRTLVADGHPGRTLFLPWHEYMSYSFIQNQNSVVSSPGPSFFSVPILASTNPEVPGIAPPSSPDQVAVAALVKAGAGGSWAEVLASIGVKYILVARELDWQSYGYLDNQPGFSRVADLGQILIYRNNHVNP